MKKVFLNFQVSKGAMNELRGGAQQQICSCSSTGGVHQIEGSTFDELDRKMQKICGDDLGWSCTPLKL